MKNRCLAGALSVSILVSLAGCSNSNKASTARSVHQTGVIMCEDFRSVDNSCTSISMPQTITDKATVFGMVSMNPNGLKLSYTRKLAFDNDMICETISDETIENYINGLTIYVASDNAARINNSDVPVSQGDSDRIRSTMTSQLAIHSGETWCDRYTYTSSAHNAVKIETYIDGKLQPAPKPTITSLFKTTDLDRLNLRKPG